MLTKILSETPKFEVADLKSSLKCLMLGEVLAKYPKKPLHLKSFNLICMLVLITSIDNIVKYSVSSDARDKWYILFSNTRDKWYILPTKSVSSF